MNVKQSYVVVWIAHDDSARGVEEYGLSKGAAQKKADRYSRVKKECRFNWMRLDSAYHGGFMARHVYITKREELNQ